MGIWENNVGILVVLLRERERGWVQQGSDITAVSDVKNYVTLRMRDVVYFKTLQIIGAFYKPISRKLYSF